MLQPREASWPLIGSFLVVHVVLLVVLIVFRYDLLRPVGQATNGIVAPDLLAGWLLLAVIAGAMFIAWGRLRLRDVGLNVSQVPAALLTTVALWIVTQLVLVTAALLQNSGVALHEDWRMHGAAASLGSLVGTLLGMALYEEVAFRGFLFPQLALRFGPGRLWLAAVASQLLFALVHLPARALTGPVSWSGTGSHLLILTLAGLLGVLLYLRTRNLLVVVGVHALASVPAQLVASPVNPLIVTVTLSLILIARPRLRRRVAGRDRPAP